MKNEPVAWMYERPNGSAKLTFVREPMAGAVVTETPLYTHPVKTLAEIIEKNKPEIEKANAYIKSLEDEIAQLKAKTLTDEEIIEIWSGMETDTGEQNIAFAKAILRKAQEK
jgi:hypothetical protein